MLSNSTNQTISIILHGNNWFINEVVNFNSVQYKNIYADDININNKITTPTLEATNIIVNSINSRNAVKLHSVGYISNNYFTFSFPLDEYTILNTPGNIVYNNFLPVIPDNSFSGEQFVFLAQDTSGKLTLKATTPSRILNSRGHEIYFMEISLSAIEYVKFIIRETDYWIVETQARDNTCGYVLDGVLTGRSVLNPVICSCKYLNPENAADAVLVNPGYKFECYIDFEYTGVVETFDNTNGLTPEYFVLNLVNNTSSIKIFYKGILIEFPNIS